MAGRRRRYRVPVNGDGKTAIRQGRWWIVVIPNGWTHLVCVTVRDGGRYAPIRFRRRDEALAWLGLTKRDLVLEAA